MNKTTEQPTKTKTTEQIKHENRQEFEEAKKQAAGRWPEIEQEIKDEFSEIPALHIREMLKEDIQSLTPLLEERKEIYKKIENLQRLARDLDENIQNRFDEEERFKKEGLKSLEQGEIPTFFKEKQSNRASLEYLNEWRGKIDDKLAEDQGALKQIEEKIGRKWHAILAEIKPVVQEEAAKEILKAELWADCWYHLLKEYQRELEIPRFQDPPRVLFPFSKRILTTMRPAPHDAVKEIHLGRLR